MKSSNFKYGIFLLLLNLTSFNSNAQQTDENIYIINQYFQLNKESSLLENKRTPTTNNNKQEQSNFITLNQIGNKNEIDIKQNVANSQTVSQLGNNNYYNFINYYNNIPSNFNIIQQGNANNLQIYGENTIINNISIIQKSDFKTLIIKNY